MSRRSVQGLALLTLLAPAGARAEIGGGIWRIVQWSGHTPIGELLVTGSTPPDGYAADAEYWDWNGGTAWPTASFYLEPGTTNPSVLSDRYTAEDFPSTTTVGMPTSVGTGDRLYRLWICDVVTSDCDAYGGILVEGGGATLHWYLSGTYGGDRLTVGTDEVIFFEYYATPPSGGPQLFRYLEHDAL